jgi:hypothetical protein
MRYKIMEANYPPKELFLKAYSRFYDSLKKRYLDGIEIAADKAYAKTYYFQSLFIENRIIPRYSVLYHSLISTFTHLKKLSVPDPLKQTLEHLSEMRSMAEDLIERTWILHTQNYESLEQLPWLYVQGIEDSGKSVLELIYQEQRLIKCSNQKIVLLLALTQAMKDLENEFVEIPNDSAPDAIPEDQINGIKLTRSQQVLIFHYLSKVDDIKHKKKVSKSANALHAFLTIQYTQITHSELYKKLLNPLTFSSGKATIQNLLVVRSFFEDWEYKSAIPLIDADIEKVKKTLK